jgi:hypothetical protein
MGACSCIRKRERERVCVCSCTLWISNPGNWPPCFEGGCQCKVCKMLTIHWNGAKAPNPKSHPAPTPSPQFEETHRTSPLNSSPSSNLSKLRVSSETSEKRGRTFHPYSSLFVSFSIIFIHLGCFLCHSKGLTIKEGRFVCWATLLGKVYAFTLVYNRVKAHYGDPLWGTFASTTKSILIWISQNIVHLILSLNFGLLV